MRIVLYLILLILTVQACQVGSSKNIRKGMVIKKSMTFDQDTFYINGYNSLNRPVITIEGNDIEVDFNHVVLVGSNDKELPNEYYGLGILIKNGKNITLKNLSVRGYKVAIMAEGVDNLVMENMDLSYNYRQRLKSIREREDLSDWLSYHQNDKDEWLRYGMAIYLKQCDSAIVKDITVKGGQNGLMMTESNDGQFYNNTIQFNSGVGIGMYRSSRNRVMHNKVDFNVRGYSHGIYQRGQDSAGILVYEQSNNNIFAYNSATHSGDGFFLWAGQSTMDSGEGGCNDNIIYGNDFSHAPTNGIEVTFSSNIIESNRLEECRYGVWAGYSYQTQIKNNRFENNEFDIAFEHGQNNVIENNMFWSSKTAIKLWEREQQPEDWGFAQKRNIDSKNYVITQNKFIAIEQPYDIQSTDSVSFINNTREFEFLYEEDDEKNAIFFKKTIEPSDTVIFAKNTKYYIPAPLLDGKDAMLPKDYQYHGRKFILVNEWGPFDFERPELWLREIDGNRYVFALLGTRGNFKLTGGKGFTYTSVKQGTVPTTLVVEKSKSAEELVIELDFVGEEIMTQFGKRLKKGTPYKIVYSSYQKALDWQVKWYNYDDKTHPVVNYKAFKNLKTTKPIATQTTTDLNYTWWDEPIQGVDKDAFGTFATTTFEIKPGMYKIITSSDDGIKVYLDGKLIINHWDIHVPTTDEAVVELAGEHTIEIEHFEGGGLSALGFQLEKLE